MDRDNEFLSALHQTALAAQREEISFRNNVGREIEKRERARQYAFRRLSITELMGQGVNGVTGDYSRGAVGFWVENGRLAYPVHEVTIAGNLRDMYRAIVDVGADVDARGGIRTGSILVEQMTVAGA